MLKKLLMHLLPFFVRTLASLLLSQRDAGVKSGRMSFTLKDVHVQVQLLLGQETASTCKDLLSTSGSKGLLLTVFPRNGGRLQGKLDRLLGSNGAGGGR